MTNNLTGFAKLRICFCFTTTLYSICVTHFWEHPVVLVIKRRLSNSSGLERKKINTSKTPQCRLTILQRVELIVFFLHSPPNQHPPLHIIRKGINVSSVLLNVRTNGRKIFYKKKEKLFLINWVITFEAGSIYCRLGLECLQDIFFSELLKTSRFLDWQGNVFGVLFAYKNNNSCK